MAPAAENQAEARKQQLVEFFHELQGCQKCALAEGRTQVVFGSGDPDADLMFVGEAPGFHEDKNGKPFVGQAGKLLDKLLSEIGLERKQVFIANVLKCRPPGNRDPQPAEVDSCKEHLFKQISLIEPKVLCTLGNFSTKLLTGNADGITKVRGVVQQHQLGGRELLVLPIFHPAAALYTPAMLEQLRVDFSGLPALLAREKPQVEPSTEPQVEPSTEPQPEREPEQQRDDAPEPQLVGSGLRRETDSQDQLGLF